ncbi:GstE2.2 family protein [Megaselia abdita]
MPKPILYGVDTSGPTRFCLLTASAIGLEVELRAVDFTKNQHKTPEFRKINPIQTTPVLEDDGHYITDSHAICTYLIQKYGSKKDQDLYPTDLVARTMVDQKLFFDTGVLFVRLCKVLNLVFDPNGPSKIPESVLDEIRENYGILEAFLSKTTFIAGNTFTLADICCMITVSSCAFVPIDTTKYIKLTEWFNKMKALPYYHINDKGAKQLISNILPKLGN